MAYSSKTGTESGSSFLLDSFESFDDAIAHAETRKTAWKARLSSRNIGGRWAGTNTFEEAMTLARMGWPEGREKLVSGLDAAKFVNVSTAYRAESLEVAGAYPNVPAFIAGSPDCMVTIGDQERQTKPIYRFLVSIAFSAMVDPHVITNRGAAILSWIDKLEAEGARCEIVVVHTVTAGSKIKYYSKAYNIKRADEPLDIDRAAFALASPAMLRRIAFSHYEAHACLEADYSSGYGVPSDWLPSEVKPLHSVYFPGVFSNDDYSTPEKAVAKVAETIAAMTQQEDVSGRVAGEV